MTFEQQFNSFYPVLKGIAKRYSMTTDIPYEEYESSLCEEFYLKYEHFDPKIRDNFNAYMRVVVTQSASRVANRSERKFYDMAYFYEGEEDEELDNDTIGFDIVDDWNLEDYIVEKETKKTDDDKLQLIDALLKSTDSLTQRIIHQILDSGDVRPTAIGRAIGIHHQKVSRKLAYLSRNFNPKQFGEISDYLVS